MRLRWVGAIVIVGVLVTSAACVGAIVALGVSEASVGGEDHVAVIEAHGPIMTRDPGGLFGPQAASAERIIEQLEEVRNDSSAKAVMLDIDSPGGGVVASEQIYNEVLRVQEEGIPVVAYFGDTAASGGYYIAAPADRIVANPGTITGSIGAIAQIPNLQELFEKIGIEMQVITSGEYKDMMQPTRPLSEEEREIIQQFLDESHEAFMDAVAAGRGYSDEEVREIADGRIYTGRQAIDNGLVDELGDYRQAVSITGELAGLGDDPQVRDYSPDPGFWDAFMGVTSNGFSLPLPFDISVDPRDMHLEIEYGVQ